MYTIKFEDPDNVLPGERKSKRLEPSTALIRHLEGVRLRIKKRSPFPVRGDDRPWHIELVRAADDQELIRRAKALEGVQIDAEDHRKYCIMGRALVLRVGRVPDYGDAHITVAFFPERVSSWLQHKLPEVVCCSSALVVGKEPRVQTSDEAEQRARRLKELHDLEKRDREQRDLEKHDLEQRDLEKREREQRERASKDLRDKTVYTFMREWARQDPQHDSRQDPQHDSRQDPQRNLQSAGDSSEENEWEML